MVGLKDVVLFFLLIFDKVVLSHECDSGKNTRRAVETMTSFQFVTANFHLILVIKEVVDE